MIFGSRDTFAIEAMCEPHLLAPSPVWGRMCIWCNGVSIGDYSDQHCGLYASYLGFKKLDVHLRSLWRPEFSELTDEQLWNLFDGALYGWHGDLELDDQRSMEEIRRDADRYFAFNFLTNWGEQFDRGGKSFIVCTPQQRVRILNRALPSVHGIALESSAFHVSRAIKDFLSWFEGESARLGHPLA